MLNDLKQNLCECGCGGITSNRFCPGHNSRVLKKVPSLCLCNCGRVTKKNYINGHKPHEMNICGCGCDQFCRKTFLHGHSNRVNHPRGMKGKISKFSGLTLEEAFGTEQAIKIKKKQSESHEGFKASIETRKIWSKQRQGNQYARGHRPVFPESWYKSHKNGTTTGMKRPDTTERNKKLLAEGKIGWGVTRHTLGESYPEKCFREYLEKNGLIPNDDFFQEFQLGIYWIDFAFPNLKIGIEIDGKQHKIEKAKERDSRKDEYAKTKGWTIIRITTDVLRKKLKKIFETEKDAAPLSSLFGDRAATKERAYKSVMSLITSS